LQTTLLGLAIAIILALVAALVGPLLIDWGSYRSAFETEATRLIGLDVRVTGVIDARLLPSPQLTLHDIEIGSAAQDKVRARALGIELALGPLLRGEWRATEMHLTGPQLNLGLDAAGHLRAPDLAIGFDPDALSIDRLSIEDGTVTLTSAAAGGSVTLDHVWFNGEARSLLGPVKGEGAANVGGDLYPFRISAGRYGDDGKLKIRVNVDPVNHPLSAEADGMLSVSNGAPSFDGSLNLRRPVGIAAAGGALSQPWRFGGKIKASASSALMQNVEFQYGSQDKGFKLTGVADFKFGKQPRFDGVLSADHIDLDRALGEADGGLRPAAVLRKLAQLAGGAFRPTIPVKLGIGIDHATLGGDTLQNVRGDISTDGQGWNLDRFEFRAPGYTQARVSGHLAIDDDRVNFTGPAEINTSDPKALTAWLQGRQPAQSELRPLTLRGELTLASDKIAVDRLTAEFDRKTITGNFAYVFAADVKPARLDAALKAADLDIDAALGFGKALLAGSGVERPHDMTVAVDIGHAAIAGLDARDLSVRLKLDASGLQLDRLSVGDLGAAALSASGRIATAPSPQGSINVDFDARDMTPVTALLARFAPKAADILGRSPATMAPAKLHAQLTVEGEAPNAQAKLNVDGSLGPAHLALNAAADLVALGTGEVKLAGKLTADDGKQLLATLGLDRVVAADSGAGTLSFDGNGPLRGELRVSAAFNVGGLEATAAGTASPFADKPAAALRVTVAHANLAPLHGANAGPLPITFSGRVALAGQDIAVSDMQATIAGAALRGQLGLTLTTPHRLRGDVDADRLDGGALIAAAVGAPASKGAGWSWSDAPFVGGIFGDYAGKIVVKARSADLLPQLAARKLAVTVNFGKQDVALDDITADIAGGRLTGNLSLHAADDGLHARGKFALAGADMAAVLSTGARPPIGGTLALSGEAEGFGLTPIALIGSLQGSGNFTLSDAQFAGLDPRAFDTVTHAVDQGFVIDQTRISDLAGKALQSGNLPVKRAQGDLAIGAGQVRLSKFTADSSGAQLSAAGGLDLTTGLIDGRLVLSGASEAGPRPDIFIALKGPVTAPERAIDVSALTGWLTLRSIEDESKKIRAIEQAPANPPLPRPKSGVAPQPARTPAGKSSSITRKNEGAAAPLSINPKRAPALPPAIVVGPLPAPGRAAQPDASAIGAQR
jgi:AsmA-like protein